MGFLQRVSTISAPARLRADASGNAGNYTTAFFAGDDMPGSWISSLTAAGVNVTPDLAMTLSAYYCGVTTIAYDLATLPLQTFKNRADGGKDPVRAASFNTVGGIGHLAYLLRWQPNLYQSAAEYFVSQIAQFLLRGKAFAEIVDGPGGFLQDLLPRHPDRVTEQRLPNGAAIYKLLEMNGQSRIVTAPEMHVVRDLSTDMGRTVISRVQYGGTAIGSGLAAERAAGKFFKSGMTAATVATYKGDMEDEDEIALHKSITRYAAGVENNFGLLLVPDDVTIANLGIEPEKAQMMLAREWTVYEVARQLRIQPRKLMAGKTSTYASAYQDAIDHVVNCLRPIAVCFEQAIQRDLILAKDVYQAKFHLAELMRGDPGQMGDYIQKLIASRAITPSEARMDLLDKNPDPALDKLSEGDNRPGQPSQPPKPPAADPVQAPDNNSRASLKAMLAVHDNAMRCLRRERAAVEKLAKKHASDVEGWQGALREFYGHHAAFVAQTMRLPMPIARGYAAQHGSVFEAQGIIAIDGVAGEAWERSEADELAALALTDPDRLAA